MASSSSSIQDEYGYVEIPKSLNEKQGEAFHIIVNERQNTFVTGAAGVGKSYVLNACVSMFERLGKVCHVVACTGVAALNVGGVTIHKWAGVSNFDADSRSLVRQITTRKKTLSWSTVEILIIDEVSMLNEHIFTKIDYIFRHFRRQPTKPFGGVQVVVFGDFLQMGPIERGREEPRLCFQSSSWGGLTATCYLSEPVRQTDQEFISLLNDVRIANLSLSSIHLLNTRVVDSVSAIPFADPVIIYSHVADVNAANQRKLQALTEEDRVYEATIVCDGTDHSINEIKSICTNSRAPQRLVLKVGAQVMVTSNINVEKGLVNGTRGVVTDMYSTKVEICLLDSKESVLIERVAIKGAQGSDGFNPSFTQFPLVLAYAFTIHKVQGLTLKNFAIDLSKIFSPGQAYVALSRARRIEDFCIVGAFNVDRIKALRSAKDYYAQLLGLSCSSSDKHISCIICKYEFCNECSNPMSGFCIEVNMCRHCLNPSFERPVKRQRT